MMEATLPDNRLHFGHIISQKSTTNEASVPTMKEAKMNQASVNLTGLILVLVAIAFDAQLSRVPYFFSQTGIRPASIIRRILEQKH